jgi:hypothetical protein
MDEPRPIARRVRSMARRSYHPVRDERSEHNAEECREEWLRKSWDGGEADQRKLDGLRERSDALLGFTADYEAFCETLNLEPEQEEQAA